MERYVQSVSARYVKDDPSIHPGHMHLHPPPERPIPCITTIPSGTDASRKPIAGLDRPRKRACLTAIHNFFLTRPDGTTAAERFFGQKPRSMFAAILESVAIPSAPLSPLRHAVG